LKGNASGPFGATYVSRDHGSTFSRTLNRCCWGFDEDRAGNIFAGVYHERGEPDAECAIYWSADGAQTWRNISPDAWRAQTHVHHLAIDPATGWLYANLGDLPELRGCWRCRLQTVRVQQPAETGAGRIVLGEAFAIAPGTALLSCDGNGRFTVARMEETIAVLEEPLSFEIAGGSTWLVLDWIVKMRSDRELQFTGLCFKDNFIYLADDNPASRNPECSLVYRAHDDGTASPVAPVSVLQAPKDSGWGIFFCELDRNGRIWIGCRPLRGKGHVFMSNDGLNWQSLARSRPEELISWRKTHTFRDSTIGQTGDGRFLSSPNGDILVSFLDKSLVVAP
jgi:hypothetical protein